MMLSEKLKEATKTAHQLVETKLMSRIKTIATKQQYAVLLSSFYSYFAALENAIHPQVDLSVLPDYYQRRKAGALADDMRHLGAELPVPATAAAIPPINNRHLAKLKVGKEKCFFLQDGSNKIQSVKQVVKNKVSAIYGR